ncbi:unnamed protein product [Adineta ricciae]|uniref:endo-1,4-beta-xylanase n=1 Tax=Adineta ricciae TaxID=249248 RepID=A0A813Q793_ADIRI|nr:unnamed protein product [Adineta ricciae]
MKSALIFILLGFCFTQYVTVQAQNPIGLKVSASLRGLLLGAAVVVKYLQPNIDQGQYNSNVVKNYQLIVPGYELKPEHIWLDENVYNFSDADWLLGATPNTTGWVQQNGMQLRGHTLVWAYDMRIPRWLLDREASITPEKAKTLLRNYIYTVVGRYRGKIQWWDVINELISNYNNTRPFYIANSFWYRKLGIDYVKYAYIFAHEADPDAKLYYNDFGIQQGGFKADRVFDLIDWLKSENVPIHGVGIQWHIKVSETVTPGDAHYQTAQRFIDRNLDLMVTELDISIPMVDSHPVDPNDIQRQGLAYRSILDYVLYFAPRTPALLTWGFTDRYSWIPAATNYTQGEALPLDANYQPKPAYWQMQDDLARVLLNGIYRLSPKSQPSTCLGIAGNSTRSAVQLYTGACNQTNQQWNLMWLGDGTYRFSPQSVDSSALNAYNVTASTGTVRISEWTGSFDQEWVISCQGNATYRIAPRNAWQRVLAVDQTSSIVIMNSTRDERQQWIIHQF